MEVTLKEFNALMDALEKGEVRVAQKVDGVWQVNREVKEIILAGFRLGAIKEMSQGQFSYFSLIVIPKPSYCDDKTKASAFNMYGYGFFLSPTNFTIS